MEIESLGNPYCQRYLMMIMISLDILILLLDLDQWVFDILPSNKDITIVIRVSLQEATDETSRFNSVCFK